MSTRERWIVYPLLFMTLGIAVRDKIIPPARLKVGEIVCNRLLAQQSECQALVVKDPGGRPVVIAATDPTTRAGMVETRTAAGMPQVRLLSSNTGGAVTTVERAGKLTLIMGDTGQAFGVFAEIPELGQIIPLTLLWRFGAKPTLPHLPQKPASPEKKPAQPSPPKAKQE